MVFKNEQVYHRAIQLRQQHAPQIKRVSLMAVILRDKPETSYS